jgi:hypothetical protein
MDHNMAVEELVVATLLLSYGLVPHRTRLRVTSLTPDPAVTSTSCSRVY